MKRITLNTDPSTLTYASYNAARQNEVAVRAAESALKVGDGNLQSQMVLFRTWMYQFFVDLDEMITQYIAFSTNPTDTKLGLFNNAMIKLLNYQQPYNTQRNALFQVFQ
jgi:hypothetical protein